jgi:hypothetical protein
VAREAAYDSDTRPQLEPFEATIGSIRAFVDTDQLPALLSSGR